MELVTPNVTTLQYVYFKTLSDRIHFDVKTKKSAHICLSTVANINQPFIEFTIEIINTDRSGIRVRIGHNHVVVHTFIVRPGLLSESEYRSFWIYFNEGNYSLGCGGELFPLIEWKDPNPFKINYVGFFSFQCEGFWKIQLYKQPIFPRWVPSSNGSVPSDAVPTGESNRGPHYIARVKHVPGRLLPKNKCLYGFLGTEYTSSVYDVLCGGNGYWVQVTNGNIPINAFVSTDGTMKNRFFIGRAKIDNILLSGKVYPWDGLCLIAYLGKEHIFAEYEIYVC